MCLFNEILQFIIKYQIPQQIVFENSVIQLGDYIFVYLINRKIVYFFVTFDKGKTFE